MPNDATNATNYIGFRASPQLLAQFAARDRYDSPALVARRDLERYYHALQEALKTIELSEGEASLICDALNGTLFEPHTVKLLWASIDDAVMLDGLAEKWNVDGPALVAKLRALDYWQALAVIDAAERFWLGPNEDGRLQTVGLVRRQKAGEE